MVSPPGFSPGTRDLEGRRAGNCATGTQKWSSRQDVRLRPVDYRSTALLLSYATELADEQGIPPWTVFRPQPLSKRCPRVCRSSSMAAAAIIALARTRKVQVVSGHFPRLCRKAAVVNQWRSAVDLHHAPRSRDDPFSKRSRLACPVDAPWRRVEGLHLRWGDPGFSFPSWRLAARPTLRLKLAAAARFARALAGIRDQGATDYTTRQWLPGLALLQQHPQ